jgi:hypothetical protein
MTKQLTKTFIFLFSLGHAVLTFIMFAKLYEGPTSGETGMVFIILAFILLATLGLLNLISFIASRLIKTINWTAINLLLLGFILFELIFLMIIHRPALFGIFGKDSLTMKNYEFLFSLSNSICLLVMALLVGGVARLKLRKV